MLRARVAALEADLADGEATHALRDKAALTHKAEIADLQRRLGRGNVSADYLKGVLVGGFESGELPPASALRPVLSRLLEFGPDDDARIDAAAVRRKSGGGVLGLLTGGAK
jgi:hypothetical protein